MPCVQQGDAASDAGASGGPNAAARLSAGRGCCSKQAVDHHRLSGTPVSSLQPVVTICVHHARIYSTFIDSVEETTRRLALMMKHDGRSAKAGRHNQMETTCRRHCATSIMIRSPSMMLWCTQGRCLQQHKLHHITVHITNTVRSQLKPERQASKAWPHCGAASHS